MSSSNSKATSPPTSRVKIRREVGQALKLGTKIITVQVGKPGFTKQFTVHEELVRASSPFFEAALGRDWKEAAERLVNLPDDRPAIFQLYIQWLYSGQMFCQVQGDKAQQLGNGVHINNECDRFEQSYILADKLQDTDFKDCIIDAIMEKLQHDNMHFLDLGQIIYSNTVQKSPARKLPVELALHWPKHTLERYCDWQRQGHHKAHVAFTADLLLALSARGSNEKNDPTPYWSEPCRYHEHTPLNKPCYKTKRGFTT